MKTQNSLARHCVETLKKTKPEIFWKHDETEAFVGTHMRRQHEQYSWIIHIVYELDEDGELACFNKKGEVEFFHEEGGRTSVGVPAGGSYRMGLNEGVVRQQRIDWRPNLDVQDLATEEARIRKIVDPNTATTIVIGCDEMLTNSSLAPGGLYKLLDGRAFLLGGNPRIVEALMSDRLRYMETVSIDRDARIVHRLEKVLSEIKSPR